jgi:hypothetical protein
MKAAAALLAACALAPAPAAAQLGDLYGRAWLRVAEPAGPELRVDLPLVEVGGQAGARGLRGEDVVLVVDVSDSTIEPCGIDLDGDGEGGATSPGMLEWLRRQPDVKESLVDRVERQDFDDSVLMAELAAAHGVVAQVDEGAFRVGIVAFSDHAWVVSPVGSSREALTDGLDHLRWNFFYDLGRTDFARAVRAATRAFPAAGRAAPGAKQGATDGRQRTILLLSDGASDDRTPWEIEEQVLAAAREAAGQGVRVFAFALGPEAEQELDVYRGIAELSGGRFEKLDRPTEAASRLRSVDFAEVADLTVENLTTGAAARALRSFPDGSFDALVELAPGPNRVRFTARARNGSSEAAERLVTYDRKAVATAAEQEEERRRLVELAAQLRERTAETRLVAEMAARRPVQRREIELRAAAARRETKAAPSAREIPPRAVGSGPSEAPPPR